MDDASTRSRCRTVAGVAGRIADNADDLIRDAATPQRTDAAETVAAELMPLCAALRWIGREGPSVLRTRRLGAAGRPIWLWGVYSEVRRVPRGTVLIIGTWNYPLLLSGVQAAQALAAGNRVLWKPAAQCEAITQRLAECFYQAGIPRDSLIVLDSDPQSAIDAMGRGVDLVVLTGSVATGRSVLARAAATLTPSIVELSGCDCLIVMAGADLERTADAVRFGLTLNSGATCIGPRRILVDRGSFDQFAECLRERLQDTHSMGVHAAARGTIAEVIHEALAGGARELVGRFDESEFRVGGRMQPVVLTNVHESMRIMHSDVFGPVAALFAIDHVDQAVEIVNGSAYRLAASVFGPRPRAEEVGARLDVGVVTVNDMIAPTADPRLPFGGRGHSGFGATRGPEGLLEMTVPRVICVRRGGPMPHLDPSHGANVDILTGALQARFAGSFGARLAGLRRLMRGVRLSRKRPDSKGEPRA